MCECVYVLVGVCVGLCMRVCVCVGMCACGEGGVVLDVIHNSVCTKL